MELNYRRGETVSSLRTYMTHPSPLVPFTKVGWSAQNDLK